MSEQAVMFRPASSAAVGGLVLTLPSAAGLTRGTLRGIATIAAADADDLPRAARRILSDLEAKLGVTTEDRIVAGTASGGVGLSSEEASRWAAAEAALARSASVRATEIARRQLRAIEQVQRRRAEQAERARVLRGVAESVDLARARGEQVEIAAVGGHTPRARRVGGLELAYRRGYLSGGRVSPDALKRAGEAYRDAYEIAVGGRGPDRSAVGAVPAKGSRTPVVAIEAALILNGCADRAAEAGKRRRGMRFGLSAVEVAVCDGVCGLDLTINDAAKRLRRDPRTVARLLRQALVRVGANRGWW